MRCSGSHLSFELYSRVARISLAAAVFLPAFLHAAFSQVAPAQAASAPRAASQVSLTTLEQGKAIEREISGKNPDDYDLPLQDGQFAEISVEQQGIDVVIDTIDRDGKILAEFDSESRPQGEERVVLACGTAAAHYQLRVKPKYSRAPAGRYQIKLTAICAAPEQDRLLSEAHVLSLQAEKSNDSGKYEDSLQLYIHALDDAEKALGPKDAYVGALLVKLGDIERTTDNRAKAEELYQRAIAVDNAALGHENPQTAWAIERLGTLYNWSDDYLRAEPLLAEGLEISEENSRQRPSSPYPVSLGSRRSLFQSLRLQACLAVSSARSTDCGQEPGTRRLHGDSHHEQHRKHISSDGEL